MKFTIGTVSSSLDLLEDIKLIKSSLLYADEIELIGMVEYAVFKYIPQRLNSINDIETLVDSFLPLLRSLETDGAKETIAKFEKIKTEIEPYKKSLTKKNHRTKQEIVAQMRVNKVVTQSKAVLEDAVNNLISSPSSNEITKLIENEIISVYDYRTSDFNVDSIAGGYFANLLNAVQNGMTYPLFDDLSNKIVSSCVKKQCIDLSCINQEVLVHAGIASNILMTLPTLDSASVDEIIDFKKEMEKPLANFRKSIYEFSEKIQSRPWDRDFQYDCLKIYNTEVLPNVIELNELSSETSVLKNMGRRVLADESFRKNASWTIGGLVTTITTSSGMVDALNVFKNWILGLSMIVVAPNVASAFLKTLSMGIEAKHDKKKLNKEIKGNSMYYYYKAGKDLGK